VSEERLQKHNGSKTWLVFHFPHLVSISQMFGGFHRISGILALTPLKLHDCEPPELQSYYFLNTKLHSRHSRESSLTLVSTRQLKLHA